VIPSKGEPHFRADELITKLKCITLDTPSPTQFQHFSVKSPEYPQSTERGLLTERRETKESVPRALVESKKRENVGTLLPKEKQ